MASTTIFTAGHGTRSLAEFVALLASGPVEVLVDVRRYPASRRHPQFARATLEAGLRDAGVDYAWEGEALGGRRSPRRDSHHVGLRVAQFRGYADHMETPEFAAAIDRVLAIARRRAVAVMCAERHWSQCHRRLIADFLVLVRGVEVMHLVEPGRRELHVPLDVARRSGPIVIYAGGSDAQGSLF